MKTAENEEEAFKVGEQYDDKPHGWIQWKGTDVCMDIYCKCGEPTHVDGLFAYNVKCSSCSTVYACNGHIELIELKNQPNNFLISE